MEEDRREVPSKHDSRNSILIDKIRAGPSSNVVTEIAADHNEIRAAPINRIVISVKQRKRCKHFDKGKGSGRRMSLMVKLTCSPNPLAEYRVFCRIYGGLQDILAVLALRAV